MPARHDGATKICTLCKRDLPMEAFGTIPSRNNRPVPRCKSCAYAGQKAWRRTAEGKAYLRLSQHRQVNSEKFKARRERLRKPRPFRTPRVFEQFGYAEIILTRGYVAVVDLKDLPIVAPHQWQARIDPLGKSGYEHVYAKTEILENGERKQITMHQLLVGGEWDVDHRDNDGLNNRRYNLRVATRSQNLGNRRKQAALATSPYKGVSFDKRNKRWVASVECQGRRYWLGRFDEEFDAAQAYNLKAEELFGEFALLNQPA